MKTKRKSIVISVKKGEDEDIKLIRPSITRERKVAVMRRTNYSDVYYYGKNHQQD
jgi:hypothetical protein